MILIALGANLPGAAGAPPVATCQAAAAWLGALPGLKLIAVSNWYRTTPIPNNGVPDYCNGVVRLEGEMTARELLEHCESLEAAFGRVRPAPPHSSRTLDVDIIDLNGQIKAVGMPILPHPRAHLRAFVLRPILDVAPSWRHPTLRLGISTLLAELPEQGIGAWFAEG